MEKLITDFQPGIDQRLCTPDERAELAAFVTAYERALTPARPAAIDAVLAGIAMAFPAAKVSAAEAEARLDIYANGLADVPHDILETAALKAIRECKFFPSVSEIRERCEGLALRRWRLERAKHLIAKHDREWQAPAQERELTAAEQAELESIMKRFDVEVAPKKPAMSEWMKSALANQEKAA